MDLMLLERSINSLVIYRDSARSALRSIEYYNSEDDPEYCAYFNMADLELSLEFELTKFYEALCVYLEMLGMSDTKGELVRRWRGYEKEGLSKWNPDPEGETIWNAPFGDLARILETLSRLFPKKLKEKEAEIGLRLESALRATATILHDFGVVPTKEDDIQKAMDSFLKHAFDGYVHKPQIPGVVKNFHADGGIRGIRTAIEFKFCQTKQQVKTAVSDLFEDQGGYRGSRDWNKFISVVYMTAPFETEERVRKDLARGANENWTAFVVIGPSSQKVRAAAAKPAKATAVVKT